MDEHLRKLSARQEDVVAVWQLCAAGWSRGKVRHYASARGWREIHHGVYAVNSAPLTRRQLWFAATLTAPGSVLSYGSGGACYGFYRFDRSYEVITRAGNRGRRRHGRLLVMHSTVLDGDITRHTGIPITTAARVLIDLAPGLTDRRLGRTFREAIRLRHTTAKRVVHTLHRHPHRPGAPRLRELATRYAHIPYRRTRSDPEALALELLQDTGRPLPKVNVKIAGEEADLVFPGKRIVEIDGPQYHQFRDEDERKAERWREAGYEVTRVASALVYEAPDEFLAACGD